MMIILLLFVFVLVPLIITVINITVLLKKEPTWDIDAVTMILGIPMTVQASVLLQNGDYEKTLYVGDLHNFIASGHVPALVGLTAAALVGFFLLKLGKSKFSPALLVLCISCCYLGNLLGFLFSVQLCSGVGILTIEGILCFLLILFPFNYLLCSARVIRSVIAGQTDDNSDTPDKYLVIGKLRILLRSSLSWYGAAFVALFPLLAVLICILVLFGQKPDAAIRAFTETSDWTLSQKVSPPPLEYSGHYLCTVALAGDPRLVSPTRMGLRHGKKIVVNRQLCVANAFEQRIAELSPGLHRVIRTFYDRHGYPLSKLITTKNRANLVYLLMKPLEWFFVCFLYATDRKPENRIAMQYTGTRPTPSSHIR